MTDSRHAPAPQKITPKSPAFGLISMAGKTLSGRTGEQKKGLFNPTNPIEPTQRTQLMDLSY